MNRSHNEQLTMHKIDTLAMPWANARVAMKVGDGIADESSLDDYDQVMFT